MWKNSRIKENGSELEKNTSEICVQLQKVIRGDKKKGV